MVDDIHGIKLFRRVAEMAAAAHGVAFVFGSMVTGSAGLAGKSNLHFVSPGVSQPIITIGIIEREEFERHDYDHSTICTRACDKDKENFRHSPPWHLHLAAATAPKTSLPVLPPHPPAAHPACEGDRLGIYFMLQKLERAEHGRLAAPMAPRCVIKENRKNISLRPWRDR
jgi:hypothetical protein